MKSSCLDAAWRDFLENWGTFSGRMPRRNFWMTVPVIAVPCGAAMFLLNEFSADFLGADYGAACARLSPAAITATVSACAVCMFFLALMTVVIWTHSVRRFHDAGRSGWLFWWIWVVGSIFPYGKWAELAVCVWLLSRKSKAGAESRFGETVPASRGVKLAWIIGCAACSSFVFFCRIPCPICF